MNQTVFGARVHGDETRDGGVVCGQREKEVDLRMGGAGVGGCKSVGEGYEWVGVRRVSESEPKKMACLDETDIQKTVETNTVNRTSDLAGIFIFQE